MAKSGFSPIVLKIVIVVRVPLLPPAKALLVHYRNHPRTPKDKLFPIVSNQKANAQRKGISKQIGLTKRLTYHCALHTFATTVTLTNGVPMETVGQMLGHKSIRSTQHCVRVTDTKVCVDMQQLKAKYTEDLNACSNIICSDSRPMIMSILGKICIKCITFSRV